MIELYKASAGSGKTYTLAKRYIFYLITIRDEITGQRRLRSKEEIKDSASHILAITFTNKATGEMKDRIVERLSDLGGGKRDAEYLKEFMAELGEPEERIREACRLALGDILVNFNNFHVSTIDSFFQTVLRTFAYEADLPDSYQVEIDSNLSARVGVDGILSSINGPRPDSDVRYWLDLLMKSSLGEGKKWNLFQKGTGYNSLYGTLLDNAKKLESESFKTIRGDLERYYGDGTALKECFEAYDEAMSRGVREAEEKVKMQSRSLLSRIPRDGAVADELSGAKNLFGRLEKVLKGDFSFSYNNDVGRGNYFKKSSGKDKVGALEREEVNSLLGEFYDDLEQRRQELEKPNYRVWQIYREKIPYLGLLGAVSRKISEFYKANNVVQLGETNTLLKRVIGDDEAPFIYERLGSYLNHYLIDEFQDTSEMQWENIVPLLKESESRGEEKLIIGDAKQSIYRFRNAAPRLIQRGVLEEFGDSVNERGNKPEENTNYRSRRRIVEFNNTLFTMLSRKIDESKADEIWKNERRLQKLYSNVKQLVSKDEYEPEGYVRVEFTDSKKDRVKLQNDDNYSENNNDVDYPENYSKIIDTIVDIRNRYSSVRSIGILVNTNKEGRWMVNALISYNQQQTREEDMISFVSDESLLIGSAESVRIVISVLQLLDTNIAAKGEEREKGVKYNEFTQSASFNFFRLQNPGLDGGALAEKYFSDCGDAEDVGEFVDSLHSAALPALVDAIIERFVSPELRRRDAAFLAAFQDLVSEQCDVYPTDVASFLKWWEQRGKDKSIATPEGQDTVNIMTIHKAKGLAFDFVIIPSLDVKLDVATVIAKGGDRDDPGKTEWRWVKPVLKPIQKNGKAVELPPYIPVPMSKITGEISAYADIYRDFVNAFEMDEMNKVYVALTRPVKELYLFASVSIKEKSGEIEKRGKIGDILYDVVAEWSDNDEPGLPKSLLRVKDDCVYEIGEKSTAGRDAEAKETRRGKESEKEKPERKKPSVHVVKSYDVYRREESPRYRADNVPFNGEDSDPRSEGNLLHKLMQWTEHRGDLDRALRRMRVSGETTLEKLAEYEKLLRGALSTPKGMEWFADDVRVLNERPIVQKDDFNRRPDRIIVTADGRAVVIDFKFGKEKKKGYCRQVAGYCKALKMARPDFRKVEGWLWYVTLGEFEQVV